MKRFIRIVIKSGLIFLVLMLVGIIKVIAEAAMQTRLGALELVILYAGAAAAIRAIYKYKGKVASNNTELSLNKDTE